MFHRINWRFFLIACLVGALVACASEPTPLPIRPPTPQPVMSPHVVVAVPTTTPTPTARPTQPLVTATPNNALVESTTMPTLAPTFTPTPQPTSFFQTYVSNLTDLSRLPMMENSVATQFTSRNWVALEHYFDWFIDDGNFDGPNYGYIDLNGARRPYRIVTAFDGKPEYEIVPLTQGPGVISRIWFAYQQHESVNNATDMSKDQEWANWGNLGQVGDIRFYFDGELAPRIDTSIKDLFVGKNLFPAPLAAFYASADGGNIDYVPIPFQHSIRVTTTGRPRMMQIEVKQFNAAQNSAPSIQSFSLALSNADQAALDQTAQAWQNCNPTNMPDFTPYQITVPHNKSAEIDFNQPGTMAGLRVHVPRGMDDSVWMQIFWDGEPLPALAAPLRALFSTDEKLLPYRALPLGFIDSLSEHLFYINFPMPFQSARIVFLNERAENLPLTVDVALRDTVAGTERSRLRAYYGTRRVNAREDDSDNYIVADVNGSGKYLGMILNAWNLDRRALNGALDEHWRFPYLESNVDVWIDNRLALPGTGIEDDFNASYYYVFAGYEGYNTKYCLAGLTLLDYSTSKEPSSQYRFYLNDAPEFQKHLRVEIQHGNKGNNLSLTYSSTAFWYQIK